MQEKKHTQNQFFFMSLVVALTCFLLSIYFPAENIAQELTKKFLFLVVVPIFYIKLVLKDDLSDFGINGKNFKVGFFWALLALIASFLITYAFFHYTNFKNQYLLPEYLFGNFPLYLFYELILVNFFVLFQTFFFQGFLMFTLKEKIGPWSIIIQNAAYLFSAFLSGGLGWLIFPYALTGLLGGILVYKNRSLIHSYFFSLLFIILLDAFFIKLGI